MRRLLLIEDNATVAVVAKELLEISDFTVDVFDAPLPALKALKAQPAAYNAVITDALLHGLSGRNLVKRMRGTSFKGPIVIWTGAVHLSVDDFKTEKEKDVHLLVKGNPITLIEKLEELC